MPKMILNSIHQIKWSQYVFDFLPFLGDKMFQYLNAINMIKQLLKLSTK